MVHTVLLAPNAFKGSLSAPDFCAILGQELRQRDFQIIPLPLGDGGDGTADILAHYLQASPVETTVPDPIGRPHPARYYLRDNTAIIELASSCGIQLLRRNERDVLQANTRGFGTLICHALHQGATRFLLCVGGSASIDGGLGALSEMGLTLSPSIPQGNPLLHLQSIDHRPLLERFRGTHFTILCDVDNPLLGPAGAAAVFGPQKGATTAQIALLEERLTRLAHILREATGIDTRTLPSGGAAGGITASFHALLGADLLPGADYCLQLTHFTRHLQQAEAVITGEGHLDNQSLHGKIPGVVARLCHQANLPVIAVTGIADPDVTAHFHAIISLSSFARDTGDAIRHAPHYLRLATDNIVDALYSAFSY